MKTNEEIIGRMVSTNEEKRIKIAEVIYEDLTPECRILVNLSQLSSTPVDMTIPEEEAKMLCDAEHLAFIGHDATGMESLTACLLDLSTASMAACLRVSARSLRAANVPEETLVNVLSTTCENYKEYAIRNINSIVFGELNEISMGGYSIFGGDAGESEAE